ncbi:MAG TPA: hypothetical protein VFC04_02010 [Actinomycetota bacterium]|nr:hypothetical protein [Actinomycetota bacterium]
MSAPFVVWLCVGLVTTLAIAAVLIALVRHVVLLGRTVGRLQRDIRPIADEIAAGGARASSRPTALRARGRPGQRT